MKRQTIAVDIDDVLTPTNDAIRVYVNEHFGANFSVEDHTQPGDYVGYFERIWQVSKEEADHWYNSFIHSGGLVVTEPLEGSLETITHLKERFDLVILSARHEDQVEMTHKWLLKHFPNVFSDVRFISGWYHGRKISKGEVCLEIGASYLIDDNVEHCMGAQENGVTALLFGEYGWSKENPVARKLHRVYDWKQVREYFDAKG